MDRPPLRLARPVYEGLPWMYLALGLASLVISYLAVSSRLSVAAGVFGILSLVGGVVVLLRRRDYRTLHSQYGNADAFLSDIPCAEAGKPGVIGKATRPDPHP